MRVYIVSKSKQIEDEQLLKLVDLKVFTNVQLAKYWGEVLTSKGRILKQHEDFTEEDVAYEVHKSVILYDEGVAYSIKIISYKVNNLQVDFAQLLAMHYGGWNVVDSVASLAGTLCRYKVTFKDEREITLEPEQTVQIIDKEAKRLGIEI